jgi:hypothetical protein
VLVVRLRSVDIDEVECLDYQEADDLVVVVVLFSTSPWIVWDEHDVDKYDPETT